MRQSFLRRLLSDRGESAITVVAGSIMFVVASIGIAGLVTTVLAAGTIAQSNTELTDALTQQTQEFKATPWSDLAGLKHGPKTDPHGVKTDDITYPVSSEVVYNQEKHAYTLHIAAPRAIMPGSGQTKRNDCEDALRQKQPGCITLSETVVATSDEQLPPTAPGITPDMEMMTVGLDADNLISHPGFENNSTSGWTKSPSNTASIASGAIPGGDGSHTLLMRQRGNSTVTSPWYSAGFGDRVRASTWVAPQGTAGSIRVEVVAKNSAGTVTTEDVGVRRFSSHGWELVTGMVDVPAGTTKVALRYRLVGGSSSSNVWMADEAALRVVEKNQLHSGDMESSKWSVSPASGGDTVTEDNRTSPGSHSIQVNGGQKVTASSPKFSVDKGEKYEVTAWVKNLGAVESSGTLTVGTHGSSNKTAVTSGLGEFGREWSKMSGQVKASSGSVGVRITVSGADKTARYLIDDVTVRKVVPDNAAPVNYVRLATVDIDKVDTGSALRVSFRNLSSNDPNPDLRVGVFCTDQNDAEAFIVNKVSITNVSGGQWYWTRIKMPPVDRLSHCSDPNIRLYPTTGSLPSTSSLGELSIIRVITPDVHGNHHTLPGGEH